MTFAQTQPDYDPVIAKAWASNSFKRRVQRDPRGAMAELGIQPPAGLRIRVVADTPETCCLVLPPPPPPGVLMAEQLLRVAGGVQRAAMLLSDFDRIIQTAWSDSSFKALLLSNPHSALAQLGIAPPRGIRFTVVEDSAEETTLVLPPPPPKEVEFSEEAGFVVNHICRWLALISGPFAS